MIFGKDFERDRAVIAPGMERAEGRFDFDVARAGGKGKVGVAAFVVVDVDVPDATAVAEDDVGGGGFWDLEIAMADVEVEPELRNGVEEFAELLAVVEVARGVLDHEAEAVVAGDGDEFADAFDVLFDDEWTRVKGGVAVGMQVHPFCADL